MHNIFADAVYSVNFKEKTFWCPSANRFLARTIFRPESGCEAVEPSHRDATQKSHRITPAPTFAATGDPAD
jgi:hypothetical protein